ncbi:MAG: hypothetical protein J7529_13235 [Roseofilum sp. Guam]|nr:hypothetical protein [Roseofilum sp. Guam]MBP0029341.1 hypothetical protein [Roseofilum sp. Guam]
MPTLLLMRVAFGTSLCRLGMFCAIRGSGPGDLTESKSDRMSIITS